MTATVDIENLLKWSAPKECNTKRGPRILRKARPDEGFWLAWNSEQDALRSAGISIAKDQETGAWQVLWWRELDGAVLQQRAQNLEQSRATDADIEIPKPEGCEYMPFQKAGIRFAMDKTGCLIGDEQGLGKTIQCLGVINAVPEIHRVLIITKASLKFNWWRECRKWLVRPMTVGIADGDCFPSTDVVIINFDLLHKYPDKLSYFWDLVAVDEFQNCKNRKTRRAKALIGYRPSKKEIVNGAVPTSGIPAKRRLALSGTPMENRPEELWTALNFLDAKTWSSFWSYAVKYCGARNDGFGFKTDGASNLDLLQRTLRSTLMIRRLKKDVLKELPPKTRMLVELEVDGASAALKAERETWARHEDDLARMQAEMELAKASDNDAAFKSAVERFRSEATVAFTEIARVRHETALAKLPGVIAAIKEEIEDGARKILIFAHHKDMLRGMHAEFEMDAVLVTGETPLPERDSSVQRFMTDPSCTLFFGSIRACGEGLNLQAATLVCFAEEDWNPSKLSQCEDRAHRIGQKDNVLVKHWLLADSLDARMIGTIMDKQKIIDAALDDEKAAVMAEPVLFPKAPVNGSRKKLDEDAMLITEAQKRAILRGLQMLSGVCDGALKLDGQGFNRVDVAIGHSLASQNYLSGRQAALGRRVAKRYAGQLGAEIIEAMG
jgi:SWI/SNF-related matrix-associated actin-dependent regulator 1 of chromatin subfamily A